MTRARMPRQHEVQAAARDPRFIRARNVRPDPSWRTQGRCRTVDPETFFPLPTEPADMAVALCKSCPVQEACLRTALETGDCEGVWGGTIPRERRAMLVAWRTLEEGTNPLSLTELSPPLAPSLRGSKRGTTRSPIHAPREHVVSDSEFSDSVLSDSAVSDALSAL